jgi:predicted transglutaminase-like cysteine proteinase
MIAQCRNGWMQCSGFIARRVVANTRRALLLATLIVAAVGASHALDFDGLLARFRGLGGQDPVLRDWEKLLVDAKPLGTNEKLRRVNDFFNRRVQFGDDQDIWGQSDYWATLLETLSKGKGDCEDFTTAKYFTLLNVGVPNDQLRLIYVKARIGGASSRVTQPHMVLAYYDAPEADPIVLDNLISDLRPAPRRPDLQPIFSFNRQSIWQGGANKNGNAPDGTVQISHWQGLLIRARAEGFD